MNCSPRQHHSLICGGFDILKYLKKAEIWAQSLIFFCLFYSGNWAFAQDETLFKEAELLVYSNPDEAIKIAEYLKGSAIDQRADFKADKLLAESYLVKGDFVKAVEKGFITYENSSNTFADERARLLSLQSNVLFQLNLYEQAGHYLNRAKALVIEHGNDQSLLEEIEVRRKLFAVDTSLLEEDQIKMMDGLNKGHRNFLKKNDLLHRRYLELKTERFIQTNQLDSARFYVDKALNLSNGQGRTNMYAKAKMYMLSGRIYFNKKQFAQSKGAYEVALRCAEIIENLDLKRAINKDLSENYLALNQANVFAFYDTEYLRLRTLVGTNKQRAINVLFDRISSELDLEVDNETSLYRNYQLIVLGLAVLSLILVFTFLIKNYNRKKRLTEILSYLEITKKMKSPEKPKAPVKKGLNIPEETEAMILKKLKRFEKSKQFLNKEMSLAVLAGKFDTNTKYLSEVINRHYNENFNAFINRLRINYIIEKLKNEPNYINYKISFLADECGFSSHSSFGAVFKAITGMPPATFINIISEEREAQKQRPHEKS